MKKIKLLFGFCLLFFSATAQIVIEESPISTRPEIKKWIAAKSLSFERMETQPIDLKKLRQKMRKKNHWEYLQGLDIPFL